MVRHPVPYGPELRRDEALAAFSTMPLLGHEAGIKQAAEVPADGWAAHLEMSRQRVDGAGGLDEEVEHPAPCRTPEQHLARFTSRRLTRAVRAALFHPRIDEILVVVPI